MIRAKKLFQAIAALGMLFGLPGCSLMPTSGPSSIDVQSGVSAAIPYAQVKLNPETISILGQVEPKGLASVFTDRGQPTAIKFGIGDVVSITIFEAAAGGLFIPTEAGVRPGNYVTIPDQTVDNDGFISVPYAGPIRGARAYQC